MYFIFYFLISQRFSPADGESQKFISCFVYPQTHDGDQMLVEMVNVHDLTLYRGEAPYTRGSGAARAQLSNHLCYNAPADYKITLASTASTTSFKDCKSVREASIENGKLIDDESGDECVLLVNLKEFCARLHLVSTDPFKGSALLATSLEQILAKRALQPRDDAPASPTYNNSSQTAVSYTHLTLPTICSV